MDLRGGSKGKPEHLLRLEKSWNDNQRLLRDIAQPKRQTQMSADIKKFVFKSVEGDLRNPDRLAVLKSRKLASAGSFNRISSTFNFVHHEGSDNNLELKVVKIILVREDQLMSLHHLSRTPSGHAISQQGCLRILETLAQIRESTLNFLEALCAWRQSIPHADIASPRPFLWQRKNYTLRLINDLDYLADIPSVIRTLNIPPEQFRNNPLMLTNNLDDLSTWMDPVERAKQEAGGMSQGIIFESRLKLRYAERILLQELEANPPNISIESSSSLLPIDKSKFLCFKLFSFLLQLTVLLYHFIIFFGNPAYFCTVNGNIPMSSLESSLSGKSVWGDAGYPSVSSAPAGSGRPNVPPVPNIDVKLPAHPYLLPLPGLDAASAARLEDITASTSSLELHLQQERPESRSAAASANSAGALARRSRVGTAPVAGNSNSNSNSNSSVQLPMVENRQSRNSSSRNTSTINDDQLVANNASSLFASPEELFPPPPTASEDPDFLPNTRTRPVSRVVLSRTGIEITPFHSEVVTTIYKYPLLIALLTSAMKRAPGPATAKSVDSTSQFPIMPLRSRSSDEDRPYLSTPAAGTPQRCVFSSPKGKANSFERLVVKVYDVIGCSESVINVIVREFLSYQAELNDKYQGHASKHFDPTDRDWWAAQIKHLIRVQLKRNGQLHMTISKKAIEDIVVAAIRKEEEEMVNKRNNDQSQHGRRSVLKKNNIIMRNRMSIAKRNPDSPGGAGAGSSHSMSGSPKSGESHSRQCKQFSSPSGSSKGGGVIVSESERAVVGGSLEDDYDEDLDFEA